MKYPVSTEVVKSPNGYQVKFTIGHQSFFLKEQTQEALLPEETITVKEYSEWYKSQLDKAFINLINIVEQNTKNEKE